ncbi:MAG: trypsin-like peptidase domain-containing protein [Anaerocolumna sp.]
MSDEFLNNNDNQNMNQNNDVEPNTSNPDTNMDSNALSSDSNLNLSNNISNSITNNISSDNSNGGNTSNSTGDPNLNNASSTYSFWAEQIAASAPDPTGPNNQNGQYNNFYDEKCGVEYNNFSYNNNGDHVIDIPTENNNKKKPKNHRMLKKAGKFVLGAAVFGVVAGACFLGFNLAYYRINPDAAPISISIGEGGSIGGFKLNLSSGEGNKISATTVSEGTIQQKTDVTDVVDATMPSIVTITATYTQSYDWFGQQVDQENEGGGSGIIVGKNDKELLIATNNHVVEGADPIKVKFIDGTEATAIIKGTDAVADLAVVSIDLSTIKDTTLSAIKVAELGDSESVKVGEMAIAIGNALGYGQSTTVGYISAKDRKVELEDKTMVLLQTDAAINPGNSGGALLNLKGEVIGINTVKYASSEVEGMGFAIPISRALPIINELMDREILADDEKGYLGVGIQDVTEDIANTYNWPVGVYVTQVMEGGSAEKAGIITGDIITKVNDTEITAGTQLKEKITSYRAGTDVTITVMRSSNGKYAEKQIVVNLGKNPDLKEN